MNIKQTLLFTALAFGLGSAQAGVTFTYGDTSGYDSSDFRIYESSTPGLPQFFRLNSTDPDRPRTGFQTFRVSDTFELQALTILTNRIGPSTNATFNLLDFGTYGVDQNTMTQANKSDNSTVLKTVTFSSAASTPFGNATDGWNDSLSTLTWTLDEALTLNTGRTYALEIIGNGASTSPVTWMQRTDNPFNNPNFVGFYSADPAEPTVNFSSTSQNLDYSLGLVAVPEPGTLALLGIAGLALALTAKRRRG